MALAVASLDELVEVLNYRRGLGRQSKGGKSGICVLVGAGASITAGISSATGLVQKIAHHFPQSFEALKRRCGDLQPTYAQAMDVLPAAAQVAIIRQEIEGARINWAHLGMARLEAAGIFDTIMTTNFDPLISRSCALLNRFPAIYDLAALRDSGRRIGFEDSLVHGSAIYHLHGQYTGFVLLNSKSKLEQQAERIRPVLETEMRGKTIIIAGYSGENDPLIDKIVDLNPGEHGLYWVCHNAKDPHSEVAERLLRREGCFVIRNQPADRLFWSLANRMNVDVPTIFKDPLEHTRNILRDIQPYSEVVETPYINIHAEAMSALEGAMKVDKKARPYYHEIAQLLYKGDYEDVIRRFAALNNLRVSERSLVAWAAVSLGNAAFKRAGQRSGPDEARAFQDAFRQYRLAMSIQPKMYEPYKNLGIALQLQAQKRVGNVMEDLENSCVAFKDADRRNPNNAAISRAWGVSLMELGRMTKGRAAARFFKLARDRFERANDIEPDNLDAMKNIGNTFWFEGMQASHVKRVDLFNEAERIYQKVELLLPGACAYNLACCYGFQARAEDCANWLKQAALRGQRQLTLSQINKDTDFDPVRSSPIFEQALRQIF